MHSGNRRRGTPRSPAAASYVCWFPRESTTARNPFPHDIPGTTATLNMVTGSTNPHGKFFMDSHAAKRYRMQQSPT